MLVHRKYNPLFSWTRMLLHGSSRAREHTIIYQSATCIVHYDFQDYHLTQGCKSCWFLNSKIPNAKGMEILYMNKKRLEVDSFSSDVRMFTFLKCWRRSEVRHTLVAYLSNRYVNPIIYKRTQSRIWISHQVPLLPSAYRNIWSVPLRVSRTTCFTSHVLTRPLWPLHTCYGTVEVRVNAQHVASADIRPALENPKRLEQVKMIESKSLALFWYHHLLTNRMSLA